MTIELQNTFVMTIARALNTPWDEVSIEYANAKYDGIRHKIYQAYLMSGGVRHDFAMSMDALDILDMIQDANPVGDLKRWSWFTFYLQWSGKYKFEFKYDDPPLVVQRVQAANAYDARQKELGNR